MTIKKMFFLNITCILFQKPKGVVIIYLAGGGYKIDGGVKLFSLAI
jgi:hypothetical protein